MPKRKEQALPQTKPFPEGWSAIYTLSGSDGAVRYVGKTNDPHQRAYSHSRPSRSNRLPVANWIRKLGRTGDVLHMRVIYLTNDWESAECDLIAEHRAMGCDLLNVAEGGSRLPSALIVGQRFPAYCWAARFAGRRRDEVLIRALRNAWALAKQNGIEAMRELDAGFAQDIGRRLK